MPKNNRLFYLWCVLVGAIITISVLPASGWIYQSIADYNSSRWVHFLTFASAAAIPVSAWKHRKNILFSFIPLLVSIALEALRAGMPGPIFRTQNVPADLFGIAAGFLLGLNIRTMHNSAKAPGSVRFDPSRSATSHECLEMPQSPTPSIKSSEFGELTTSRGVSDNRQSA